MDNVTDVVDLLQLNDLGEYDGDTYIVELNSSDRFANLYTEIADKFEADEEGNSFDDSKSVTSFSNDNIEIVVTADYDADRYAVSIRNK